MIYRGDATVIMTSSSKNTIVKFFNQTFHKKELLKEIKKINNYYELKLRIYGVESDMEPDFFNKYLVPYDLTVIYKTPEIIVTYNGFRKYYECLNGFELDEEKSVIEIMENLVLNENLEQVNIIKGSFLYHSMIKYLYENNEYDMSTVNELYGFRDIENYVDYSYEDFKKVLKEYNQVYYRNLERE